MVLSMVLALVTVPAVLGTNEAIRQGQSKEKREEHRARRCNLIVTCLSSSKRSREIDGKQVVLRGGKLYIDTSTAVDSEPFGHPFAGYYLPYPDKKYEGLVTTITEEAPILNWVYLDKDTYNLKYGVRADAQPHLTGPFDCTRQDRRMTFEGWEGFCAVEEEQGLWAIRFDRDDDGLRSKIHPGMRVLEIELTRKEKRWKKDKTARQEDQTTTHDAVPGLTTVNYTTNQEATVPITASVTASRPNNESVASASDAGAARRLSDNASLSTEATSVWSSTRPDTSQGLPNSNSDSDVESPTGTKVSEKEASISSIPASNSPNATVPSSNPTTRPTPTIPTISTTSTPPPNQTNPSIQPSPSLSPTPKPKRPSPIPTASAAALAKAHSAASLKAQSPNGSTPATPKSGTSRPLTPTPRKPTTPEMLFGAISPQKSPSLQVSQASQAVPASPAHSSRASPAQSSPRTPMLPKFPAKNSLSGAAGATQRLPENLLERLSDESVADTVVLACGAHERYYVCWKTRDGVYHQESNNLPPLLQDWLFPSSGRTRDFPSLQVILSFGDGFLAYDKDGKISSYFPRRLSNSNSPSPNASPDTSSLNASASSSPAFHLRSQSTTDAANVAGSPAASVGRGSSVTPARNGGNGGIGSGSGIFGRTNSPGIAAALQRGLVRRSTMSELHERGGMVGNGRAGAAIAQSSRRGQSSIGASTGASSVSLGRMGSLGRARGRGMLVRSESERTSGGTESPELAAGAAGRVARGGGVRSMAGSPELGRTRGGGSVRTGSPDLGAGRAGVVPVRTGSGSPDSAAGRARSVSGRSGAASPERGVGRTRGLGVRPGSAGGRPVTLRPKSSLSNMVARVESEDED